MGWETHNRIAVESGKGWLPHLEEAGEEEGQVLHKLLLVVCP
jgi:hypothetical protein